MKKIIFSFLLIFSFLIWWNVFAWEEACPWKWDAEFWCPWDLDKAIEKQSNSWWSDKDIKVKTTEKVPWANCVPDTSGTWTWEFICTITPWFSSVQSMVWQIIKYFTWLAALAWVLFIVVNWMLLSMWWDWADEIKKRIKKTIMWLILLLLSWVILYSIAPWIYK